MIPQSMLKSRNHKLALVVLLVLLVSGWDSVVLGHGGKTGARSCLYSLDAASLPPLGHGGSWHIREFGDRRVFTATLQDIAFTTTTFTACVHFSQISTLVVGRIVYEPDIGPRFLNGGEISEQVSRLANLAFSADDTERIRRAIEGVDLVMVSDPILIDHNLYNMFELTLQQTPTLLIITISYAIS